MRIESNYTTRSGGGAGGRRETSGEGDRESVGSRRRFYGKTTKKDSGIKLLG